MMSLEGVEYHQKVEELAETKEEVIRSLKYRDEKERFGLALEELDDQSCGAHVSGIQGLAFPEELEFELEIPWEVRFF